MVDTERTVATLLATNFVDGQAAGSITPQDMRDLIVSLTHQYGDGYISTPAATTISTINVWVKVAGTTTIGSNVRNVSMPANNRLRNDGDQTRIFRVTATLNYITAGANKEIGFGIGLNGTVQANTEIRDDHLVAANERTMMVQGLVSVAAASYVEAMVVNRTDTDNVTVNKMVMHAIGLTT